MTHPSLTDRIIIKAFNIVRKAYSRHHLLKDFQAPACNRDPAFANSKIRELLLSDAPCMIGRFGSNELDCTVFYHFRHNHKYDLHSYMKGESDIWWYPQSVINSMYNNAGFFTPTIEQLDHFGQEMLDAMPLLNVLGSWRKEESYFDQQLKHTAFIDLELLNPLWGSQTEPWTTALKGKKVLVVHPYTETIQAQYAQRQLIHHDPRILPEFDLKTIKSVQSITGIKPKAFNDWFEALHHMEQQIDQTDYDVCLVGCGAYGFLLAAHCKRMGHKAVHLGGALQLLFGIKGKRWEDPTYGFNGTSYLSFFTPHWVRPSAEETPAKSANIENGCYW